MEATDKSNYFMTEKPPEAFIDLILSLQIAAKTWRAVISNKCLLLVLFMVDLDLNCQFTCCFSS